VTRGKKPAPVPEEGTGAGPVQISYDVRIWSIRELPPGKKSKTGKPRHQLRWKVGDQSYSKLFETAALARSFQAKLRTAANEGEPFTVAQGLPLSMAPKVVVEAPVEHGPSCYELAVAYSKMKWPTAAPGYRRGISEALAAMMLALLWWEEGHPSKQDLEDVHLALSSWAFNLSARQSGLPEEFKKTIRWIEGHSFDVAELADADVVRSVLTRISTKLDGQRAAESTLSRKRATFFNFLKYAVEKKHLEVNPLLNISWAPVKNEISVDRRRVVNEAKGRQLLIAAGQQGSMGRHLLAYFGCLFLGGLRPGEATALSEDELDLPDDEEEWGWLHLGDSSPEIGGGWTDSGEREIRQLKHRAVNARRPVPVCPLLGKLLRRHIEIFGTVPDGRLFRGEGGGLVSESTVNRVWSLARKVVLSPSELKSVQAERPYDLRHARLSIWLNSGVDPAQISEWAGNSVPVLLRVYIHCLTDSQESALAKLGRKGSQKAAEVDLSKLDRLLAGEPLAPAAPVSVYELAVAYAAEKRSTVKPLTMKGAVETLTKVTVSTLDRRGPWPTDVQLVQALTSWAFSGTTQTVPDDLAEVLAWVAENSPPVVIFRNPDCLEEVLVYLSRRLDGGPASAAVRARRRSALHNFLEYAVDRRHLPANPLIFRQWSR